MRRASERHPPLKLWVLAPLIVLLRVAHVTSTFRAQCQDPGGSCFCDMRDSRDHDYGDLSQFWNSEYGLWNPDEEPEEEEEEAGAVGNDFASLYEHWQSPFPGSSAGSDEPSDSPTVACRTACVEPAEVGGALGFCGQGTVDYRFCVRAMTLNASLLPRINSTGAVVDEVAAMDAAARKCFASTPWAAESSCGRVVARGSCYFMFPRCNEAGVGLPICRSFCENERRECRQPGSNLGSRTEIRDVCAGSPFVDATGPSSLCTGGGPGSRGRLTTSQVGAFLVAAGAWVWMLA